MSNFRVGQKVVCVNTDNAPTLEMDRVYTIVSVLGAKFPSRLGTYEYGVTVAEAAPLPGSIGFAACRFRPVVERKTDIGIFRAMLTPAKQPEDA